MTQAIGAFYDDPGMQSRVASASGEKTREKKLGDIWEKFKGELHNFSLGKTAHPRRRLRLQLGQDRGYHGIMWRAGNRP